MGEWNSFINKDNSFFPLFSPVAFKGQGEGRMDRRAASADMPIIYNRCCCAFRSDGKLTALTKSHFSPSEKYLMFSLLDLLPGWGVSPPDRRTLDVSRHLKRHSNFCQSWNCKLSLVQKKKPLLASEYVKWNWTSSAEDKASSHHEASFPTERSKEHSFIDVPGKKGFCN